MPEHTPNRSQASGPSKDFGAGENRPIAKRASDDGPSRVDVATVYRATDQNLNSLGSRVVPLPATSSQLRGDHLIEGPFLNRDRRYATKLRPRPVSRPARITTHRRDSGPPSSIPARGQRSECTTAQPAIASTLKALSTSGYFEIRVTACRMELEGIISKHRDRPLPRSQQKHWVKVKNRLHPAMGRELEPQARSDTAPAARAETFRTIGAADRPSTLANGEDRRAISENLSACAWDRAVGAYAALLKSEGPPARRPILLKIANCIILRLRNAAVESASPGLAAYFT